MNPQLSLNEASWYQDMARASLLEDWRERRDMLAMRPPAGAEAHAPAQIHVLDYLLKRYEGSPEAAQPARFPLQREMVLMARTIVVHHHMGWNLISGVKSRNESEVRTSAILKRISAQDPQSSLSTPGRGALLGPMEGKVSNAQAILNTLEAITSSFGQLSEGTLFSIGSFTKEYVANLEWEARARLFACCARFLSHNSGGNLLRIMNPSLAEVADFFIRIEDASSLGYVMLAWIDSIVAANGEENIDSCERILLSTPYKQASPELVRAELANSNPNVRSRALSVLIRLGDLHDVGLLSDLLNLPRQDDEYPGEREAMLSAMRALSGQSA